MHAWPSCFVPALPGVASPLRVYDTASHELRIVETGPTARMYVCGITPYDATHIGHAATYLAFDLINRQWRDAGLPVEYVQNVTDVDDPLLVRAAETGVEWQKLAESEIDLFREDMTELRILPPDAYVGVVESMQLVIDRVAELIESGAAYQVDSDWYFDVSADSHFGSVGNLDRAAQLAFFAERGGDPERVGKRDALDCLLWLAERPGEPAWDSPMGRGRPGWHLECVAIALDKLGMSFDVQGGAHDLIFPHHEMGASQAQVLTGEFPYAHNYVHAGLVALDGEKMSKSKGNLVFVSRLRNAGVDPVAIRLALLAHHYRSDWEWTDADLGNANLRLAMWRAAVAPPTGPAAQRTLEQVRIALADDLDAPRALHIVDQWAQSQVTEGGEDPSAPGIVSRMCDALLGLVL